MTSLDRASRAAEAALDDGKVELASREWLELMRRLLTDHARSAPPDTRFSVCETFTHVPPHLDRHGDGRVSWYCIIEGNRVTFGEGVIENADVRSEADYEFILPVARWIYTPEVMDEVAAYKARGIELGKYKSVVRDGTVVPPCVRDVHNEIARRTL